MQLGHSWRPMCGVVVELGINDIFCRSAFKDAVLWYNSSPVTPQFATWRFDMVIVAHNHFCCAERSHGKGWQGSRARSPAVRIGRRIEALAVHSLLTTAVRVLQCMYVLHGVHRGLSADSFSGPMLCG